MEPKKSTGAGLKIALIVLVILVIIFGIYFGLAWFLREANSRITTGQTTSPTPVFGFGQKTSSPESSKVTDNQVAGEWETACLVPDSDSPWSEKHHFSIKTDGTAVHTRWSNDTMAHNCSPSGSVGTLTDNYRYTIPAAGQINLEDTTKGATLYDIYQVSGSTLLFGHGFCNCSTVPAHLGASDADRISSLNQYLQYQKQ